jgi:hypothetical protein
MDGDEGQGMIFNFLFALAYESNMSAKKQHGMLRHHGAYRLCDWSMNGASYARGAGEARAALSTGCASDLLAPLACLCLMSLLACRCESDEPV